MSSSSSAETVTAQSADGVLENELKGKGPTATTVARKSSARPRQSNVNVYVNASPQSYSRKPSEHMLSESVPIPQSEETKEAEVINQPGDSQDARPSGYYKKYRRSSGHSRRSTLAARYEHNGHEFKRVGFENDIGNSSDSWKHRDSQSISSRGNANDYLKPHKQRPGAGVNFFDDMSCSIKSSNISKVLDNLHSIESILDNNQAKAPGCQVPNYDQVNVDEVKLKLHSIMDFLDTPCMASRCDGSDKSVTEDASLRTDDIQAIRLKLQSITNMADEIESKQCQGAQCTRRPPSCAAAGGGNCDTCYYSLVAAVVLSVIMVLMLMYWMLFSGPPLLTPVQQTPTVCPLQQCNDRTKQCPLRQPPPPPYKQCPLNQPPTTYLPPKYRQYDDPPVQHRHQTRPSRPVHQYPQKDPWGWE